MSPVEPSLRPYTGSSERKNSDRGAGLLRYVFLILLIGLIGYYLLVFSVFSNTVGSLDTRVSESEQAICEALGRDDCGPTVPWEPHEPEQLDWGDEGGETCVFRLCW